jgi:hypothetical protein
VKSRIQRALTGCMILRRSSRRVNRDDPTARGCAPRSTTRRFRACTSRAPLGSPSLARDCARGTRPRWLAKREPSIARELKLPDWDQPTRLAWPPSAVISGLGCCEHGQNDPSPRGAKLPPGVRDPRGSRGSEARASVPVTKALTAVLSQKNQIERPLPAFPAPN